MMIVHEVILLRLYKRNLINCFLWSLLRKKKQASPLCKGRVLNCLSRAKDLSKRQGSITNPGFYWLPDRKGFQCAEHSINLRQLVQYIYVGLILNQGLLNRDFTVLREETCSTMLMPISTVWKILILKSKC